MYHFELRKFPHAASRFNQSERQLLALVVPWVREEWVELGERKWNVNETKLTVLEGPELSLQDMAMNRGWRNAQRKSENVTERVLAAAAAGPAGAGGVDGADAGLFADSLALELLGLLDAGPTALPRVWRLAHERLGARPASESLALAERAIGSLVGRRLAELVRDGEPLGEGDVARALGDPATWSGAGEDALALARRA